MLPADWRSPKQTRSLYVGQTTSLRNEKQFATNAHVFSFPHHVFMRSSRGGMAIADPTKRASTPSCKKNKPALISSLRQKVPCSHTPVRCGCSKESRLFDLRYQQALNNRTTPFCAKIPRGTIFRHFPDNTTRQLQSTCLPKELFKS